MRKPARWLAAVLIGCASITASPIAPASSQLPVVAGQEVFYQIFFRSFRDSNGDRDGDLKGLTQKLDYIAGLGATSILLTPIQPSPFYHNYFATAFRGVDPSFGTMANYFAFVRAAHARGLKVYLDQEFQYVAQGHPWLADFRAGKAPFASFILPSASDPRAPEPFLDRSAWPTYDGRTIGIAMVDLGQPAVQRYFKDLMLYWLDPHGDGSLRDGIDGFRIDHMMDDLDNKHRLTNLFASFWAPIFKAIRTRNPRARILAEQSDWGYGGDWLTRGGADLVFAFPMRSAIDRLDKAALVRAIDETAKLTPAGKGQIVFLENHDTDRFASLVRSDPAKLRLGAALTVLLQGEPLIYYGQELGMKGAAIKAGMSDATQIPMREAMRWRRELFAPGSAIWYQSGQPWWTGRANRSGDGVSVEEEARDPGSLLNWYRRLLKLRASRAELRDGRQTVLCRDDPALLCILREHRGAKTLLLVNLGATPATASGLFVARANTAWSNLLETDQPSIDPTRLVLGPWEVAVLGS